MPVMITVCAARADHRVACHEAHPDHPGGTAWVVGDERQHVVALTREVARRIGDGSLIVVGLAPQLVVTVPSSAQAPPARAKKGGA